MWWQTASPSQLNFHQHKKSRFGLSSVKHGLSSAVFSIFWHTKIDFDLLCLKAEKTGMWKFEIESVWRWGNNKPSSKWKRSNDWQSLLLQFHSFNTGKIWSDRGEGRMCKWFPETKQACEWRQGLIGQKVVIVSQWCNEVLVWKGETHKPPISCGQWNANWAKMTQQHEWLMLQPWQHLLHMQLFG